MAKTTRQTAAITGAGDGIGRALAINLNERGIDLYLCDISQERLDTTVAMLDTTRSSVSTALVDCGKEAKSKRGQPRSQRKTTAWIFFQQCGRGLRGAVP